MTSEKGIQNVQMLLWPVNKRDGRHHCCLTLLSPRGTQSFELTSPLWWAGHISSSSQWDVSGSPGPCFQVRAWDASARASTVPTSLPRRLWRRVVVEPVSARVPEWPQQADARWACSLCEKQLYGVKPLAILEYLLHQYCFLPWQIQKCHLNNNLNNNNNRPSPPPPKIHTHHIHISTYVTDTHLYTDMYLCAYTNTQTHVSKRPS